MTGSSGGNGRAWVTLRLQVSTPVFNGGAMAAGPVRAVSAGVGIRVPSLRGAMRFWFRAFTGSHLAPDPSSATALAALAAAEAHIFGSVAKPSAVRMRMHPRRPSERQTAVEAGDRVSIPDFRREATRNGVGYLLGPGLYDSKKRQLQRPYVDAGTCFDLQLRNDGDEESFSLALASLWLLCVYGGLGARARRGFGGLRILDVDGTLPHPWSRGVLTKTDVVYGGPDEDLLRRAKPLAELGQALLAVGLPAAQGSDVRLPASYPVLTDARGALALSCTGNSWADVLTFAGKELRAFRATETYGQNGRRTPEWGAVVQSNRSDHFGLGALGLPVVYSKDPKISVNATCGVRGQGEPPDPREPLRRASPLWLRPVLIGESWQLFSFAFRGVFLPPPGPDGPTVRVFGGPEDDKEVRVKDSDVISRTQEWIHGLKYGRRFAQGNKK